MRKFTKVIIVSVALATAGAMAFAAKTMENDAVAGPPAKISIAQAITAAELHANGKATGAQYEQTKAGWAYDVEVISGTKVWDVRVDADKGTVIASTEDAADRDDETDQKD